MARQPAIHFNPATTYGRSRCGKKLNNLLWRTDKADVTCNLCLNLLNKDRYFDRSLVK